MDKELLRVVIILIGVLVMIGMVTRMATIIVDMANMIVVIGDA